MHGGSGVSAEGSATAIEKGIRKINYYTYMSVAGGNFKDLVREAGDGVPISTTWPAGPSTP